MLNIPSLRRIFLFVALVFALCGVNPAVAASSDKASPGDAKVKVNEATAEILSKRLKGIGGARATAIVEYREEHGSFDRPEDLLEVNGIGEGILEDIEPRLAF